MDRSLEPQDLSMQLPMSLNPQRVTSRAFEHAAKRAFDLSTALTLIVLLMPLILVIAVLIRSSDGGSAFFRQDRIGRRGRPFKCWKFRTMACDAEEVLQRLIESDPGAAKEWAERQKLTADPRVTAVGWFLRKSSLDELPQLLNIIAGDMSFVGPRPIVSSELDRYGEAFPHCFSVPPGLTGLWQVSGRSDCSYATRVALDAQYVSEWGLMLDMKILVKTVPAVLMQRGSR